MAAQFALQKIAAFWNAHYRQCFCGGYGHTGCFYAMLDNAAADGQHAPYLLFPAAAHTVELFAILPEATCDAPVQPAFYQGR